MANQILYGFRSLQGVLARRITEIGITEVFTAIQQTVEVHNDQIVFLLQELATPTTDFQRNYRTMGSANMQPIDENGRALVIKAGAGYTVAFPFQRAAVAWGQGFEAGKKMTVQEANENTALMAIADNNWMRYHVFAGLFNNVSYTFTDDQRGAITVVPLANGDSQTYYTVGGGVTPGTANHFLAQAAGIADATNPFDDGYDLLKQYPENNGEVFALVPTGLMASIRGLTLFTPLADPNIQVGVGNDRLVGSPGLTTPGVLRGYVEGVWIYEWATMPANYIIMRATGSPSPLAMRQDEVPELQGLFLASRVENFPWEEVQYRRGAGFGVQNRTSAVIIRIGNASYAPPTDYALPMP